MTVKWPAGHNAPVPARPGKGETDMAKGGARRTGDRADLENGARMTQPEFHRLYEQTPEHVEFVARLAAARSPAGARRSGKRGNGSRRRSTM